MICHQKTTIPTSSFILRLQFCIQTVRKGLKPHKNRNHKLTRISPINPDISRIYRGFFVYSHSNGTDLSLYKLYNGYRRKRKCFRRFFDMLIFQYNQELSLSALLLLHGLCSRSELFSRSFRLQDLPR